MEPHGRSCTGSVPHAQSLFELVNGGHGEKHSLLAADYRTTTYAPLRRLVTSLLAPDAPYFLPYLYLKVFNTKI